MFITDICNCSSTLSVGLLDTCCNCMADQTTWQNTKWRWETNTYSFFFFFLYQWETNTLISLKRKWNFRCLQISWPTHVIALKELLSTIKHPWKDLENSQCCCQQPFFVRVFNPHPFGEHRSDRTTPWSSRKLQHPSNTCFGTQGEGGNQVTTLLFFLNPHNTDASQLNEMSLA